MNREIIAKILRSKMKDQCITAGHLIRDTGLNKKTVYTILQYGQNKGNYTIDNLLKIIRILK